MQNCGGLERIYPGIAIEDAGLVLGADTILVRMGETRSGAKALAVEADRERLLSLLGVSYRDQVPPGIVKNIENASEQWRRGEKTLAHIHLAFAGLPRLESANDAYRLYLARSSTMVCRRAKCSPNLASTGHYANSANSTLTSRVCRQAAAAKAGNGRRTGVLPQPRVTKTTRCSWPATLFMLGVCLVPS